VPGGQARANRLSGGLRLLFSFCSRTSLHDWARNRRNSARRALLPLYDVAAPLSALDVESVVLTGAIVERQKHRETREWKYVVHGQTLDGRGACVVAKFGAVGSLYILTVYEE
jgi:hypothetical protein